MATYVEEVVGASELLEHLESHHEQRAVKLLALRLEAIDKASLDVLLVFDGAAQVLKLAVNLLVLVRLVNGDTARASEGQAGLVVHALGGEPTRGLGHGEDADAEDEGPEETDGDDCAP